jgi:hypothetical protein
MTRFSLECADLSALWPSSALGHSKAGSDLSETVIGVIIGLFNNQNGEQGL